MPLKFTCPQCQSDIEVSRQAAGSVVPCPHCQATVQAPSLPAQAPASPASTRVRQTKRSPFAPPRDSAVKLLWVGMMLVMVTFGIKHLLADAAISSVPSAMQYPKLIAQRDAELFKHRNVTNDLQRQLNEAQQEAWEDDDYRGNESDEIESLRSQIRIANEESRDKIEEINEKYEEKLEDARQDALNASASGLGWVQRGIWVKLLVDIPKLLGCLFIVFASMSIVSDPNQDGHVKTYATACSTVILVYTTAYAFMAFLS